MDQLGGREAGLSDRQHRLAERVVFNVKGNDYRLVVAIDYEKGIVWIKWLGTHAEYDRIDVRAVAHEGR